jgi:hypothetical protein
MRFSWPVFCIVLIALSLVPVQPIPTSTNLCETDNVSSPNRTNLPKPAQEIGEIRSFWTVDYDQDIWYLLDAYLLAIGNHCYIYMDDLVIDIIGQEEANNRAELYRDEFDNTIYPRVTELAGDPDGTLGDIDGDPRIFILIMENRWSCYRQSNEIEGPHSNLCEMVYICYRSYNVLQTIAHEFHHLVWFNYEFDEVHFILEGLAEYAMYYAGCLSNDNLTNRVSPFLEDPDDSFIYFEIEAQDYGACYLFAFYLAEQYGLQFLQDLVQHEEDGALGLETALEEAGYNISFDDLYMDWMTALTIDVQGFANDRYCLRDIDTTIQGNTAINSLPYQDDDVPLYCYGSKIYHLTAPPESFCVEMSQPKDGFAGLSVAYKDDNGWHVQQVLKEGRAIIDVSGDSIVTAHIVASYLLAETPAGGIDFGSGFRETVQVLIQESNENGAPSKPQPLSSDQALIIIAAAMPLTATIIVLVLKFKGKEKPGL